MTKGTLYKIPRGAIKHEYESLLKAVRGGLFEIELSDKEDVELLILDDLYYKGPIEGGEKPYAGFHAQIKNTVPQPSLTYALESSGNTNIDFFDNI